ncbi:unnamed protein product, partial [marine sediment metagenome]
GGFDLQKSPLLYLNKISSHRIKFEDSYCKARTFRKKPRKFPC